MLESSRIRLMEMARKLHYHITGRLNRFRDNVMRFRFAFGIMLIFFSLGLFGRDFSCRWEPGLVLDYRLRLETRVHFDLDHREKYIETASRYFLRFYVVQNTPRGEALVASVCRLEEAAVAAAGAAAYPREAAELQSRIDSFSRKEDFSFLLLDRRGRILKGRMPWPDSVGYYVPQILEGIAIDNSGSLKGSCLIKGSEFQGMGEHSGRSCRIYSAEEKALDLRLYVDSVEGIPCLLTIHFAHMSHFTIYDEVASLEILQTRRSVSIKDFSSDPLMRAALIQCAVVDEDLSLDPEMIRASLAHENPRVRKTAAGYFAVTGKPADPGLGALIEDADDVVRFNIAKGIHRYRGDSDPLRSFLKSRDPELRVRARNLLETLPRNHRAIHVFDHLLEEYQNSSENSRERDIYRAAVAKLSVPPPVGHFGPKSFTLNGGKPGEKCFHYNVWIPEDYDPRERYPVIIGLSGGNGFSEWYFRETVKRLPDHYILVSPDAGNAPWWEPEKCRMIGVLIQSLGKSFSVDWDRIYLQGFSNGGIATYLYSYLYPDRFAAAACMMGFAPRSDDRTRVETEMFRNLRNLPLLIIHGARDRTISVTLDRILAAYLKKNDLPHRYIELENKGHEITLLTNCRDILGFFRKIRRNPAPRQIELIVDDPRFNRSFWVRVDEKSNPARRARVNARITGKRIIVNTRNVKSLSLLLNDRHYEEGTVTEVVINGKRAYRERLRLDRRTLVNSMLDENDGALIYGVRLVFDVER